MEARFQNVDPNQDYDVRVSTMVNGTIIAQMNQKLNKNEDPDKTLFLTPGTGQVKNDHPKETLQFVSVDLEL